MKIAIETIRSQRRTFITKLIGIYLVINGIALILRMTAFPDHCMFWFGPALLLIYVVLSRMIYTDSTPPSQVS
jgi:hypothetical protein